MARTYLGLQRRVVKLYDGCLKAYNPGYGTFKFEKPPRAFRTVVNASDVVVLNQHELNHLKKRGFRLKLKPGQRLIMTRGATAPQEWNARLAFVRPLIKEKSFACLGFTRLR